MESPIRSLCHYVLMRWCCLNVDEKKQGKSMFKRKIIDKLITELDVGGRISILPGLFPAEFRCVWSRQDAVSRPSI